MPIQYTWKVTQLKRKLDTGLVFNAFYEVSATDGEFSAETNGRVSLGQPDSENFIPYEDLTESVVLNWVYEKVGKEMENLLLENIENQKNPKEASGLPW